MNNEASTLQKLNLKRVDHTSINDDARVSEVEPLTLIDHRRFDIMAKYIYGKFHENNLKSSWGYRLYEDHIWVFNNYDEDDASGKRGIASFITSFNATLKSVKENGFDADVSLLPIDKNNVPIDGAHRLAAALLYNKKVKTIKVNDKDVNYNYEFFKQKGLLTKWGDAITYEYCKLKQNTFFVVLFPEALEKKTEVKDLLNKHGAIYYEKDIRIEKEGPRNLIMELYKNGDQDENIKPSSCIKSKGTISVFIFETKGFEGLLKINKEVKRLYSSHNHSFYISQTQTETIRLTQMLLNENSIHFLNNAVWGTDGNFNKTINEYKNFLNAGKYDKECFCIISDTVLGAYGIRELQGLDFIHEQSLEESPDLENLRSYNGELLNLKTAIDDIIFNPENHFYYDGIKFATLETVKSIKKKQYYIKDSEGIQMINKLLTNGVSDKRRGIFWYEIRKKKKMTKLKMIAIKLKYKTFLKKLIKSRTIT